MFKALSVNAYVRFVENGSLVYAENFGGLPGPLLGAASIIARFFSVSPFCLFPMDLSFEKLPSSTFVALPLLVHNNLQQL